MSVKTFAAIDIGSFELTMKIFEFSGKNKIREIDSLTKRIDIGSDTYATGKISSDKVNELCETLKEFTRIMSSYKVDGYKAYGTSAIRESKNRIILLDQIEQNTGIKVEVLSNSEQRFLDYKSIAAKGASFRKVIEENTAIVDIGGGSLQISLFENDTLVSTQNLKLGVLRVHDVLNSMNASIGKIEGLVDEMASAQLSAYKKLYLKDISIKNIIIVDDYISPLAAKMAKGSDTVTDISDYEEYLGLFKEKNVIQIAKHTGISEEVVPLTLISGVLTKRIAMLMGATKIWVPGVTLCDGMAYEYAEKIKMFQGEHDFEQDIVACAVNISKRYMGSKKRGETLEKITTTIFDGMKKVHGLGNRERLYLRIAAILHDCGKYVSLVNIGETSYNIIMATEIIGLSHKEREIVANIVRFNHTQFKYYGDQTYYNLDKESYLIVAKLVAILRLAGSLDRSHKQKMKAIKASLNDSKLILTVDSQEDITLESGYFESRAEFFKEVFSITPILKQRKSF